MPHLPITEKFVSTLEYIIDSGIGVITHQNLVEFSVVLTKFGIPEKQMRDYLGSFINTFLVVHPLEHTLEHFLNLIDRGHNIKGVRFFDYYLVATLLSNDINTLYTYNISDFQRIKDIQLWSPVKQ